MAQAVKTNIVPEGYQKAQLYEGDTMAVVNLREVFIYPQVKFKNKREQAKYNKLVRDVKRTLPYAKMVYDTLIETYEYMETFPNDKARQAHLKRMEKGWDILSVRKKDNWLNSIYSTRCLPEKKKSSDECWESFRLKMLSVSPSMICL